MPSNDSAERPERRGTRTDAPRPRKWGWGGWRPGAGRKPKGDKAGVPHRPRAPVASRFPVHVTVELRKGLPKLREPAAYEVLRGAFAAANQSDSFRIVHYSVQNDHLHLLVEAPDRDRLARGMQGLLIRVARRLNRLWGRKGTVFADRYRDHVLRTPDEVRAALVHVLLDAKRHGLRLPRGIDPFSSAPWFDGWRCRVVVKSVASWPRPVAAPRTRLLASDWRRHGLLDPSEAPKPSKRAKPASRTDPV